MVGREDLARHSMPTLKARRASISPARRISAIHRNLLCILTLLVLTPAMHARAQDITASGQWTETIDSSDLESGAGSDLPGTYESDADATTLDVTYSQPWRVSVHRADVTWSPGFTLYARRTSSGTGSGSISGGLSYIEVTTLGTELFTGSDDRTGIDVQYSLTGMSIGISPATYRTTVTYTVVAN